LTAVPTVAHGRSRQPTAEPGGESLVAGLVEHHPPAAKYRGWEVVVAHQGRGLIYQIGSAGASLERTNEINTERA